MENKIIPSSFREVDFTGSWGDPEIVQVAETIVIIQKKMNLERWMPFTFSNYMELCNHIANGKEKQILERLVITGYFKVSDETKYVITPLFLEAIGRYASPYTETKPDKKNK